MWLPEEYDLQVCCSAAVAYGFVVSSWSNKMESKHSGAKPFKQPLAIDIDQAVRGRVVPCLFQQRGRLGRFPSVFSG